MDFFNYLKYLMKNRIIKKIILICVSLLIVYAFKNFSFGFSQDDLTNSGFTSAQMNQIYDFIQTHKENYDSVFVRYAWANPQQFPSLPEKQITFTFYNYEDLGSLYITTRTNNNINYTVKSQYNVSRAAYYYSVDMNDFSNIAIQGYRSEVTLDIRDSGTGTSNLNNISLFATNRNVYTNNALTTLWFQASDVSITNYAPYIINYNNISSWDFNTLNIGGFYLVPDTSTAIYNYTLDISVNNGQYTSSLNVKPYTIIVDNNQHIQINVPRQQLLTNYNIQPNDTIQFTLKTILNYNNNPIIDYWDLGTYTLGLTQSEADTINSNSNKQQLTDINNSIQDQTTTINNSIQEQTQSIENNTDAINNLENTITDPTVSDDSIDLPTLSITDPTQTGIDQLFTQFYNAFCTGSSSAIVFPIPNTNKNITLPGNFVYDMLHNNGGDLIINIINAFWWYTIGSWVVKDIWDKIYKIQQGDVEHIQTSNIKADML